MIDDLTIHRILDSARIDEVVSEFVTLRKRGANYTGLCPFHNEKTPSFSVSPVKGIYKCFGCGKAGNSVNFLMEHEHITYPDALRWLARKYHIDIQEKEITPEEIAKRDERESIFVATTFAHEFFVDSLHKTDEGKAIGLSYFQERGFRDDIIKKFELGYSSEKSDTFLKYALKNGFKNEILQKAGLINKGNFDSFSGRVLFPIHNLSGRVVGFTGRILKKEKSPVKYFNSPESEIFHKGKILFGLFLAKKAIADKDKCFLVEGNTDVVSMFQAGIENCVASSGTALSIDQITLIKRFTKNITILYDGDPAGIKAALRGIDLLLEEGMHVKVVLLPDGEDPDSFSRSHSSSELVDFLEKEEKDFFAFKTKVLLKDAGKDPVKRSEVLNDIIRSLALVPDNILRSLYIKECSRQLKVEEQLMHSEVAKRILSKQVNNNISYSQATAIVNVQPHTPQLPSIVDDFYAELQEYEILRLMFRYGNDVIHKKIDPDDETKESKETVSEFIIHELLNDELELKNLVYRRVFVNFHEQLKQYGKVEPNEFIFHTEDEIHELAANLLSIPYYNAKIKGQSDLLSKYYERVGIHVKTEDTRLKNDVSEVIIRYKIKVLEIARRDRTEKLTMAQETNSEVNIQDQLFMEIKNLDSVLNQLYFILGQVVC